MRPPDGLKLLASGALGTGAGGVVVGAAGFALTAVVALGLGIAGAGVFGVCMALSMVLTQVGKLGYDTALVHLLPRLHLYGGADQTRPLIRRATRVTVTVGVVLTLLGLVASAPLADALLSGAPRAQAVDAIRAMLVGLPTAAVSAVQLAAARGLGDVRSLVVVDQLVKPIGRLVVVAAVIAAGGGVVPAIMAWSMWQWVTTGGATWALRRLTRGLAPDAPLDHELARDLGAFVRPRSVSASLETVGANVGLLIVGAFATIEAAGVYSVASRLVLAGVLPLQAVRLVVAAPLSKHLSTGDTRAATQLHQTSSAWVVLAGWPFFIVMALWPGTVMSLFGSDFSTGGTVAAILALGGLASVAAGNVQTVLLMSGRSGSYLGVAAASLVVNAGFGLALVHQWGGPGVAIAGAAAVVFENATIAWLVYRGERVSSGGSVVYTAMLLCVVAWGVPAAAVRLLGGTSVTALVVTCAGSTALFAVLCWLCRARIGLMPTPPNMATNDALGAR
jgi:O-antigen/teichoic acid export membrane protein